MEWDKVHQAQVGRSEAAQAELATESLQALLEIAQN
jgi:hypothetical protein